MSLAVELTPLVHLDAEARNLHPKQLLSKVDFPEDCLPITLITE
jgi:hypothetical protein